jgi:hypothetical protein
VVKHERIKPLKAHLLFYFIVEGSPGRWLIWVNKIMDFDPIRDTIRSSFDCPIFQLRNQRVAGSNPASCTNRIGFFLK